MPRLIYLLFFLLAVQLPLTARADEPAPPTVEDYRQLAEHRFGSAAAIPADGMRWSVDAADFVLTAGRYQLQSGAIGQATGFWFEGSGSLSLAVPDRFELQQLRRLLREPELDRFEASFDRMLIRASSGPPMSQLPSAALGGTQLPEVESRHRRYAEIQRFDVDAQIVSAFGIPNSVFWQADIRTPEHGWVTITYDSQRGEELTVECFNKGFDVLESWLSLDRAEERSEQGRPTGRRHPLIDIHHVDIKAEVTTGTRKSWPFMDGRFQARIDIEILEPGLSVLPLRLRSRARVLSVSDTTGVELDWIRDHIGGRSSAIDKEIYDNALLVLLPEAVAAGTRMAVVVDYEFRRSPVSFISVSAQSPSMRPLQSRVSAPTKRRTNGGGTSSAGTATATSG